MNLTASTFPVLQLLIASGILLAGVVDDLKTRKFHNWLFLTCTAIGFLSSFYLFGLQDGAKGMAPAMMGFFGGFFLLLPLVMLKVIGAGDLKLMAAFGAATDWNSVLAVGLFGLVWGAIFGITRVVVSKQAPAFAKNMMQLALLKNTKGIEVHTIPYTVALFFGWLTYLLMGNSI